MDVDRWSASLPFSKHEERSHLEAKSTGLFGGMMMGGVEGEEIEVEVETE